LTYPTSDGTNGQFIKTDGAGNLSFATSSGSSLWTANGSDIYYNTGDVSIGTTTASANLHVYNGTSQSSIRLQDDRVSAGGSNLELYKSRSGGSANDNDLIGEVTFRFNDSTSARTIGSRIQSTVTDVTNGTEDAYLAFFTTVAGTSAERVRITGDGIGYGIDPDALIHAFSDTSQGTIKVQDDRNVSGTPNIELLKTRLGGSASDNDNIGQFTFRFFDSGSAKTIGGRFQSKVLDVTNGTEDANMSFEIMDAGTLTEKLTITPDSVDFGSTDFSIDTDGVFWDDANRRLGIGTDTPDFDLHIYNGSSQPIMQFQDDRSNNGSPAFIMKKSRSGGSASDNDRMGDMQFRFVNSASSNVNAANVRGVVTDVTSGTEDSYMEFLVMSAGSKTSRMQIDGSGVNMLDYTILYNRTDANRGAAGTAGRMIFNTDDGQINIDDGTNWTLSDGTTT
jgi:hypothetical protein